MALHGTGLLYLLGDITFDVPFLVHAWYFYDTNSPVASLVAIGETDSSSDNSRQLRVASGASTWGVARDVDTGSANANISTADIEAGGGAAPGPNVFNSIAGDFFSDSYRRVFVDKVAGTANTNANTTTAPTKFRIFGELDSTAGSDDLIGAEVTVWNTTGMDAAARAALVTRIGTKNEDGSIVNPLSIQYESGGLYEGLGLLYFTLENRHITSRTDKFFGTVVLAETADSGAWADDQIHSHPFVADTPTPSITSTSPTTWVEGGTATLTGSIFLPVGVTDPTVEWNGVSVTVADATDTLITTGTLAIGDQFYGVPYAVTVANEQGYTNASNFTVSMGPASGEAYASITEQPFSFPVAAEDQPKYRLQTEPPFEIGWQFHYKALLDGTGASQAISNATIYADGGVSVDTDIDASGLGPSILVRCNDGNGWSPFVRNYLSAAANEPVLVGTADLFPTYVYGATYELDLSEQVSEPAVAWTWSDIATLPAGMTLNTSTGVVTINTVTLGVGTMAQETCRATGTLEFININFTVTITAPLSGSGTGTGRKPFGMGNLGVR